MKCINLQGRLVRVMLDLKSFRAVHPRALVKTERSNEENSKIIEMWSTGIQSFAGIKS